MTDEKIMEKIFRTLTEKQNYIVCSIEEFKVIETLSVDSLQSSLIIHEQKFSKEKEIEEEEALNVSFDEGHSARGRRRMFVRGGSIRRQGGGRGRYVVPKATIECYISVTNWDITSMNVQGGITKPAI